MGCWRLVRRARAARTLEGQTAFVNAILAKALETRRTEG